MISTGALLIGGTQSTTITATLNIIAPKQMVIPQFDMPRYIYQNKLHNMAEMYGGVLVSRVKKNPT